MREREGEGSEGGGQVTVSDDSKTRKSAQPVNIEDVTRAYKGVYSRKGLSMKTLSLTT